MAAGIAAAGGRSRNLAVPGRCRSGSGIDWAAPRGTAVRAAGHGIVVEAGRFGAYGHYVRIEHGATVATTYAHLERYAPGLRPGRWVRQGDLIGRGGSTVRATGPH